MLDQRAVNRIRSAAIAPLFAGTGSGVSQVGSATLLSRGDNTVHDNNGGGAHVRDDRGDAPAVARSVAHPTAGSG